MSPIVQYNVRKIVVAIANPENRVDLDSPYFRQKYLQNLP